MNVKMLALVAGLGIASTSSQSWAQSLDHQDREILGRARATSMYLVKLTNTANPHITDPKVKAFMTDILKYHTMAAGVFTRIARNKGMTVSDHLNQRRQRNIERFSAVRADLKADEYTRLVIASLTKEIQNLEQDVTRAKDADVKSYATRRLADLEVNMRRVRALRSDLKLRG